MRRVDKTFIMRFVLRSDGAVLTEMAIVIPLLLLLVTGAMEYGRLGYTEAMAQKATELAARTASVRPAACSGVPTQFEPVSVTSGNPPRFGTLCRAGAVCKAPAAPFTAPDGSPEFRCTLAEANATTDEIWQTISPFLPNTAERGNIQLRYTHDARLGFLGGPYTPIVTAEVIDLEFEFVTPLGALAELAMLGGNSSIGQNLTLPTMSASLPGEDLGQGAGS